MNSKILLSVIISFIHCFSLFSTNRLEWYQQDKLGMFFHYGVYSAIAGKYVGPTIDNTIYTESNPFLCNWGAEWIMSQAKIPRTAYKSFAPQFTASQLNMDAWMDMAYAAGMKYVVLTVKHHEGFLLYPSKHSSWCTTNSGAQGRDIAGEFFRAAKKKGLKAGIYFSQNLDWMEEGGLGEIPELNLGTYPYELQKQYIDKTCLILTEILDNYGDDIDLYWWDIRYVNDYKEFSDQLMATLHNHPKYKKEALHNDRMSFYPGDFSTVETSYTEIGDRYFERCKSLQWTWGYSPYIDHIPALYMIDSMLEALTFGGNFLFNVPPKEDGTFDSQARQIVAEVGEYVNANRESIYATQGSGLKMNQDFGRITRKGNTLYLHKLIKNEPVELVGFKGNIKSAQTLTGKTVDYTRTISGYLFGEVNQYDVIKVEFDTIEVEEGKTISASEEVALTAYSGINYNYNFMDYNNSTFNGPCCRLENPIEWYSNVKDEGVYELYLCYSSDSEGSVTIRINGTEIKYDYKPTAGDFYFEKIYVDAVYLNQGEVKFEIEEADVNKELLFYNLSLKKDQSNALDEIEKDAKLSTRIQNGILTINYPSFFQYEIFTPEGKLIKKGISTNYAATIDLSNERNRIILVKVKDIQNAQLFFKKLVCQ